MNEDQQQELTIAKQQPEEDDDSEERWEKERKRRQETRAISKPPTPLLIIDHDLQPTSTTASIEPVVVPQLLLPITSETMSGSSSPQITISSRSYKDSDEEFVEEDDLIESSEDDKVHGSATSNTSAKLQRKFSNNSFETAASSVNEADDDVPRFATSVTRNDENSVNEEEDDEEVIDDSASEEEEEESSDSDDGLSLEDKLIKSKQKNKETKSKMRSLVLNIEEYKNFLELERNSLEARLKGEAVRAQEERDAFAHKAEELTKVNMLLKEQFDKVVEEYEAKMNAMNEDKKARTKENVDNLQTLIKELTYIEDMNENLTNELAKERETHSQTRQELDLSKQLIDQLEKKLAKQSEIHSSQQNGVSDEPLPQQVSELQKQLVEEKKKMQSIVVLLGQIRGIALPGATDNKEDAAVYAKLQEELESHAKTKQMLEEEKKKATTDKQTIDKLQKRIKDLIQTHSNTLQQISSGSPGSSPRDNILSLSDPAATTKLPEMPKSPAPAPSSAALAKKKDENLTLEEKIQMMFMYVDTGRLEDLTKLVKKTKGLVHAMDAQGRTALHKAAVNGASAAMVKFLIDNGVEPNSVDSKQWTVLHYAAKCPIDNSEVLKLLLKLPNIKVDMPNSEGNLPLHFYARSKIINQEVFGLLVSKTQNVNYQNNTGDTPLHQASFENNENPVITLLKSGADPNIINLKGESPLHNAARTGQLRVLQILIELGGANAAIKGSAGTAYDVAAPIESIKSYLQQQEVASPRKTRSTVNISPSLDRKDDLQKRIRSQSGADTRVPITVVSPDLTVKTPVDLSWTIKEAATHIKKKFPSKMATYELYLKSKRLDEAKRLSDYPELMEKRELLFQPSQKASRATVSSKATRSSKDTISISAPVFVEGSSGSGMKRSSSMKDLKLTPLSPSTSSSSTSSLENVFKAPLPKTGSHQTKRIIKAQAIVRGWLARRSFKELAHFAHSRKAVVVEIATAESTYLKGMQQVYTNWAKPILESTVLPKNTKELLTRLFTSYETIMKLTEFLATALKDLTDRWNVHCQVGKIFLNLDPPFSIYSTYAKLYYDSYLSLQDKVFISYIMKIPGITEPIASSISMWLNGPVAHIGALKKHLSQLLRYTFPDHPDSPNIQNLMLIVDQITTEFEQPERNRKNMEEMIRVENKFGGSLPLLKVPDRFYIKEAELMRYQKHSSKPRYVVLFSDSIIFGEKVQKPPHIKYLETVELQPTFEVQDYNDKAGKGFVITGAKESIILFASTTEEKVSWIRLITSVLSDLKEAKKIALANAATKVNGSSPTTSQANLGVSPKPNSKRWTFGKGSKVPAQYNNATTVLGMVAIMDKDACYICLNKFGVTRRKYECKRCTNPVCKNCTVKDGSGLLCKNCLQNKKDSINRTVTFLDIPDKVLINVFQYLEMQEFPKLAQTCKRFWKFTESNYFWKKMYRSKWRIVTESADNPYVEWRNKCIAEYNWNRGKCSLTNLKGHGSSISALQFHGNTLVSGSVDTTIKIWNIQRQECIATLKGHTSTVKCLEYIPSKNMVLSVSDNAVKIWNLETASLIQSLKLHTAEISAIQYEPERNVLITASDKTIKVTDMNTFATTQTVSGLKSKIYCFQARKDMLLAGCKNDIRMWDLKHDKALNTLKAHSDVIRCLACDSKIVASGSDDNTIRLFEKERGDYTLSGHKGKIQCIQFDKNKLVSGSTDATIKIWSLATRECVATLNQATDAGWVRCLQFNDDGLLVSGHGDSLIRLWNFNHKR